MDTDSLKVIGANFNRDWDGTVFVPYLSALKKPTENLHIKDLLPLDTETPFGNLQLSWMSLVMRTQLINEAIDVLNRDFDNVQKAIKESHVIADSNIYIRPQMSSEILVYLLRTTADRLIMLLSLVESLSKDGKYPNKIKCDSVAGFLNCNSGDFCEGLLDPHRDMLETLNVVANSFKHSFLNLQTHNILMQNTPGVIAMYQPHNNSDSESVMGHIIFVNAVREFDNMASLVHDWLSSRLIKND